MKPLTWRLRGVFGGPFGTQGVMRCSLREFADCGAVQDFRKYCCILMDWFIYPLFCQVGPVNLN